MIGERERETTYDIERCESIGHGDAGDVCWDLVLHAQGLEFSPFEAVEIHGD